MPTKTLKPNDKDAKRYEDLRKANLAASKKPAKPAKSEAAAVASDEESSNGL